MADEISGNAGPATPVESDNLSLDQFADLLSAETDQTEEVTETAEETESTETEEESTETADEETEDEEENEETETTDTIDFDQLTAEQWDEIANRLGSKAAKRIAKLTRKTHELDEQLQTIQQQQPKPDPLEKEQAVENPRIAAIKTIEDLSKAKDEAESVEEWAQNILDANGSAGADEVIYSEGDNEYTKERLIAIRNGARKAQKKDIPARLKELERAEQMKAETEFNDAKAAEMIPELSDDKSPVRATYDSLMDDPVLKKAIERTPELRVSAGVIMALAARAANQLQQAKAKPKPAPATGTIPKAKPPGNPSGAGAAPSRPGAAKAKDLEALRRKAEGTGNPEDFAALYAAQL